RQSGARRRQEPSEARQLAGWRSDRTSHSDRISRSVPTFVKPVARRKAGGKPGIRLATVPGIRKEGSPMAHVTTLRHLWGGVAGFFEHAAAVVIGFVLMVLGLALGVTMIMLPVGVVIGLIGFALFVAGMFARMDER